MATRIERVDAEGICAEFRASGQSRREFCESRGIAKSRLSYWLYRRCRTNGDKPRMVRVGSQSMPIGVVRIRLKEGISIELPRPVEAEELRLVLSAVGGL